MSKKLCFLLPALIAGNAAAQPAAWPDPADPRAMSPATRYESAFKGYRPYADVEIARWRDSNHEVGRLGGHRGHVPKPTSAAPAAGVMPSAPRGQGGGK